MEDTKMKTIKEHRCKVCGILIPEDKITCSEVCKEIEQIVEERRLRMGL